MQSEKALKLAPKTGAPIPPERIAGLIEIAEAAKTAEATGFVIVAIGPDFTRWREGHVTTSSDRHNLLGQLVMSIRQIEDAEEQS